MARPVNPATGETLAAYPFHSPAEVAGALERAARAFPAWRDRGPHGRAPLLARAAAILRERKEALARLAVREMGKPVAQAWSELDKCAWMLEHYAAHAPALLADEPAATEAARSVVRWEPLGALLAVMPWNFPYWQVFRCAGPALAAGNTVVLKHASNVPGAALAIEEVIRDAGFPAGALVSVRVPGEAVPDLVARPEVAAVSLTGSDAAGAAVGAAAGAAIKKCVLELGGSDPFVVLDDADLAAAARVAARARVQNNGQSCIAAKRFIVAAAAHDEFLARLVAAMRGLRRGDPLDPATELGPLARHDLRDELHRQVERTIAAGARLETGGAPLPGPGVFYEPTVLAGVTRGMAAFDEETFGPVAAVIRVRDDAEAVALANASRYGLGASVWTRDPARGEALAARLEAGVVFVNAMVKSDPRLPFGGVKRSGFGRELGAAGLREFTGAKAVWVA